MLSYPQISPELVRIGPFAIRWYGIMYVLGFVVAFHVIRARIRNGFLRIPLEAADSFITYIIVGMLVGARLTYVFVYNWEYYSMNWGEIFAVWAGGLSFHGAMIGMIGALYFFARKHQVPFQSTLDTLAIGAPPGLFFGRMGNFINGELYGRPTESIFAMIFPNDPLHLPRHPSQLYQAFSEGFLLFVVLCLLQRYLLKTKKLRHGMIGAAFVSSYGLIRFVTEFAREPDAQLGYFAGFLSMGQILCLLMVVASVFQWVYVLQTQPLHPLDVLPRAAQEGAADKPNMLERALAWCLAKKPTV